MAISQDEVINYLSNLTVIDLVNLTKALEDSGASRRPRSRSRRLRPPPRRRLRLRLRRRPSSPSC